MTDTSGWWVKLTDGATTKEITRVRSVNPRTARNAVGDVVIEAARDDSVLAFAKVNAELRLYRGNPSVSGTLVFRGFLHSVDPDDETMTLRGPGIGELLGEDAPDSPVTITNTATHQALEDYISNRTPFTPTVIEPDPSATTRTDVQSADTTSEFDSVTSIADGAPFFVSNGTLELAQSCFFFEAESRFGTSTLQFESAASDGAASIFNDTSQTASAGFTPAYRIPATNVDVAVRVRSPNNADIDIDVNIDGSQATILTQTNWDSSYQWVVLNADNAGDLDASSHTLELDVVTDNGGDVYVDCLAVLDNRFSYTFDNSVDSDGYLSGPELYPDAATLVFDNVSTQQSIGKGYLSVTDDDGAVSKLQLSFDDGSTYVPTDGSEANVDSVEASPPSTTQQVRGRVSLTRIGSRSTASPTTGFEGGSISTWDLDVDLLDTSVVDEIELTESDLSNIQTLLDYGDYTLIFEHEESSKSVIAYPYGQSDATVEKQLPGRVADTSPGVNADNYANRVIVRGAEDSNGNRPEAIVEDSGAISNDPRTITLGPVYDNDLTTGAGVQTKAESLLEQAQRAGEVRGSVTLGLPHKAIAGFQYEVDFGDGPRYLTAEEVEIQDGERQTGTVINFDRRSGLAQEIEQLTSAKADASNS
jgi:hypothetical protein